MSEERRKQIEEAAEKEKIYEPKYGGKDHSGYDTLMRYEVNYEREEAFCNGAEWADANPDKIDWSKATATSDMGAFNFVVRLQDQIKQLQSDLVNINLEAKSVEQENVSLKHDRKLLVKALKKYAEIDDKHDGTRFLAIEVLKKIGEGE